MKTILKFFGATCAVIAAVFLLSGAAIDNAGRLWVSTGATNNAIKNGFASMVMGTGNVTSAASVGPNRFTNFSYALSGGNVGTVSNIWVVVTNAGNYRVAWGAGLDSGNNDTISLQLWTNGPGITPAQMSLLSLEAVMNSAGDVETGFKQLTLFLPAGLHLFLQSTNSNNDPQVLKNVTLAVQGAL